MNIKRPVVFLLYVQISVSFSDHQQPVVETSLGKVKGDHIIFESIHLNVFKGIPFAKPPVGELRFKKPQSIEKWNGIYDATQLKPQCSQWTLPFKAPWVSDNVMNENCLYLNIWSPVSCQNDGNPKKDVIIWIIPGGFIVGDVNLPLYDGTALAAIGCMVVVSFSYRLTAFGFLNFGTEDVPGNQGMWDQHMAIMWIRDHISGFGGDPSKMTLFGESAGAISIGFHLLSPKSQGLIHRAIMLSGAPSTRNMIQPPDFVRKNSLLFAELAGCLKTNSDNVNSTVLMNTSQCLRKLPTQQIIENLDKVIQKISFQAFWPIYGDDLLPANSTMRKGISHLTSTTYNEGPLFLLFSDARFAPILFQNQTVTIEQAKELWFSRSGFLSNRNETNAVDFNFKGVREGDFSQIQTTLMNLAGQSTMVCPTQLFAERSSDVGNDVYYFIFRHRPGNSVWPPWFGVSHFDDVQFPMGHPLLYPDAYTSEEMKFSRDLVQMFSSFVRTGVPLLPGNASWPLFSQQRPVYMELKPGLYTIGEGFEKEACQLWKHIFPIV